MAKLRFDLGEVAQKIATTVGPAVPIAATVLGAGNPMSGIAGLVVKSVAEHYGVEPDSDELVTRLQSDPLAASVLTEAQASVVQAQLAAQVRLAEIDLARAGVAADDTANARTYRELDDVRRRLAFSQVFVLFAMVLMALAAERYLGSSSIVLGALIALIGGAKDDLAKAWNYFFGTSGGSTTKERRGADR